MSKSEEKAASAEKSKFRDWYETNAKSWNGQRRTRYKTDPVYREKVLARNRQHRSEKKAEQRVQAKKEQAARKGAVKVRWKTFVEEGKEYHSIGSLAERLGVSVQAVRLWERQGVIAPPNRRTEEADGKGQRLYTLDEIEQIRKVLKAQGRLPGPDSRERGGVRSYEREVTYANGATKTESLYTIGVLARTIPKTVVTLEHHERENKLPKTPLRGSSVRRRLYTLPMIEVVKAAFDRWGPTGPRGEEWTKFYDEVHQGWKKQGIIGAKLSKNPNAK